MTDDAPWSMTNGLPPELQPQGTIVSGLHVGYMDTDMTVGVKRTQERAVRAGSECAGSDQR